MKWGISPWVGGVVAIAAPVSASGLAFLSAVGFAWPRVGPTLVPTVGWAVAEIQISWRSGRPRCAFVTFGERVKKARLFQRPEGFRANILVPLHSAVRFLTKKE